MFHHILIHFQPSSGSSVLSGYPEGENLTTQFNSVQFISDYPTNFLDFTKHALNIGYQNVCPQIQPMHPVSNRVVYKLSQHCPACQETNLKGVTTEHVTI